MRRIPLLSYIKKLDRPLFTTFELAAVSGKSPSVVIQSLNYLCKNGLVLKLRRGIWAEAGHPSLSPYAVIPYLFGCRRTYVSFLSALHLYDIIEQIPQNIMLASTGHTRSIRTKLGIFSIHQISAGFFKGFGWYKNRGEFLIAEPEKALVDCLYLSVRKKRQFGHFPELHFSNAFSFNKARRWAQEIPDKKMRIPVLRKLEAIRAAHLGNGH